MTLDYTIAILTALAAAFKWLYEYSQKLKWEKNKFLLEQLEKFQSQETTQVMEKLLDWNFISVTIKGSTYKVNDAMLFEALQTHNNKHSFSQTEVALRKTFDDYFDNLTKMILLCKSKLISEKNFKLFYEYWLNILSGRKQSKSRELKEQIHNYLDFYGYDHLLQFIKK